MMTQEKHTSLKAYLADMQQKAANREVPVKHKAAPEVYRAWLAREIERTQFRLDNESILVPKKAK